MQSVCLVTGDKLACASTSIHPALFVPVSVPVSMQLLSVPVSVPVPMSAQCVSAYNFSTDK